MILLLLACDDSGPMPAPSPCTTEAIVIDPTDDSLGFSPEELLATLAGEHPLDIGWDEDWGPPEGAEWSPTLVIGGIDGEPQRLDSFGADPTCIDELRVPVAMSFRFTPDADFAIDGIGLISGTLDEPRFSLGYRSDQSGTLLTDQAREWMLERRAAQYEDFDGTDSGGVGFWGHGFDLVGDRSAGRLVLRQTHMTPGRTAMIVIFQGQW